MAMDHHWCSNKNFHIWINFQSVHFGTLSNRCRSRGTGRDLSPSFVNKTCHELQTMKGSFHLNVGFCLVMQKYVTLTSFVGVYHAKYLKFNRKGSPTMHKYYKVCLKAGNKSVLFFVNLL